MYSENNNPTKNKNNSDKILISEYALLVKNPKSPKLIICFSGFNTPVGKFDYYKTFESYECNLLLLNSRPEDYYVGGVPGLGNCLPSTIEAINKLLGEINEIDELITFGTSMGGWGALLYGTYLNANRIIAIGPRLPEMSPALYGNEIREHVIKTSSRYMKRIFENEVSNKTILYGDHSWHDIYSAALFGELKNTKLHMFTNKPHNLTISLIRHELLKPLIFDSNLVCDWDISNIFKNRDMVNSIFYNIYDINPNLNHNEVYSAIESANLIYENSSTYRLRAALGQFHKLLGDYRSAIWNLEESLRLNPNIVALKELLTIYNSLGRHDEAVSIFDTYNEKIEYSIQETDELALVFKQYIDGNIETIKSKLKEKSELAFESPVLN